jgi:Disaggregatase related repeat
MKLIAIFFTAITVLVTLTKAKAATYSLEPVADARVIHLSGASYDSANYASDILSVYTDSSQLNTQRTFIQFDLSSITLATNEAVQSATLTLIASTAFGSNPAKPMEIYRVLSPWTETGLTWLNRDATHAWTNGGGDFVGIGVQPYAVSTNSPASGAAVTWDITTLVQEWVTHTSTNYGLVVKSSDGNHLTFSQRESMLSLRPKLTVVTGLAPLQAHFNGGQVVLWWVGAGVLQEKTNLSPAIAWSDSGRTVTQSIGTNSVTISGPTGNRFFRLRNPP